MRHLNRAMSLVALAAALTLAALIAGCSSGPAASGTGASAPPSAAAQGGAQAAGYHYSQAMRNCLHKYGIKRTSLRQAYYGTGTDPVSEATIKEAGIQCWKTSATGLAATALRRVDSCLKLEGVSTPHTGSPLADVLLDLEVHNQKVRSALKFCLRT